MQTTSEPRYLDIPVTILDFMFVGGHNDTITLREGDSYDDLTDRVIVTVMNAKTAKVLETVEYYKANLLAFKYRDALLRIRDTRPIPPPVAEDASPVD